MALFTFDDFPSGNGRQGLPCSVAALLLSLDDADRAVLESVLADLTIGHATIERTLAAKNLKVGTGTVGKHRRGDCRCAS